MQTISAKFNLAVASIVNFADLIDYLGPDRGAYDSVLLAMQHYRAKYGATE